MHNGLESTPEPYECFDIICGTSTGGLVAILLGRLGKTLDECENLFRKFGSKIFEGNSLQTTPRLILGGSRYTNKGLADVIKQYAGEETMYEADAVTRNHVPTAVVAVAKTTHDDHLFRTYGTRARTEACPIVAACLATSAATTFFPSVEINGVEYVDGAFRQNNPSAATLLELESSEWVSQMGNAVTEVAYLVSIGTGRPTYTRKNSSRMSKLLPKGASSMKDAAELCIQIATDCHRAHLETADRFNKAGVIDAYCRFDVDRGLELVELNESDQKTMQHISAVTQTYLKNQCSQDMRRCARLINPRHPLVTPTATIYSQLPQKTTTFYGREEELNQIRQSLDPFRSGRKRVLLSGIGECGKTQLALQHIEQEKSHYSAIVWVNTSTKEQANWSLTETVAKMATDWPPDLPSGNPVDSLSHVRSRLRTTVRRNWLLVIDSADDLGDELAKYVPDCLHGSVLVTSTNQSYIGFKPHHSVHIGGLDSQSSLALLHEISKRDKADEQGE